MPENNSNYGVEKSTPPQEHSMLLPATIERGAKEKKPDKRKKYIIGFAGNLLLNQYKLIIV